MSLTVWRKLAVGDSLTLQVSAPCCNTKFFFFWGQGDHCNEMVILISCQTCQTKMQVWMELKLMTHFICKLEPTVAKNITSLPKVDIFCYPQSRHFLLFTPMWREFIKVHGTNIWLAFHVRIQARVSRSMVNATNITSVKCHRHV